MVDYATGPFIQFPILFVVPVALATWNAGRSWGWVLATTLPLARLSFFSVWPLASSWLLEGIDTMVDVLVLHGLVLLIDRIRRQQHEIRLLEGLLPICSFCKRIRDASGVWEPLEPYITRRSEVTFTHTVCPRCGVKHYPGLMD